MSRRGFATLDPERRREIARMGGKKAHALGTAHEFSQAEAKAAGHLGGKAVSRDREHMAKIGRIGGSRTPKSMRKTRERLVAIENEVHAGQIVAGGAW